MKWMCELILCYHSEWIHTSSKSPDSSKLVDEGTELTCNEWTEFLNM